ncbi:MAG: alkaline phosphatase family protein [Byssovorax sp.]
MRLSTASLFTLVPLLTVAFGCSSGDTTTASTGSGGSASTTSATGTGGASASTGAGGSGGAGSTTGPTTGASSSSGGPTGSTPKVLIVLMENHVWSAIKASPSAKYIHMLAMMGAHSEQHFNPPGLHPSEPNYLWLEAGDNLGVLDDSAPGAHHFATKAHLVTQIEAAGLTWKTYQEGISGADCPLKSTGKYAPKHNPMVYFDDVTNGNMITSQNCIDHVRPFPEIDADLTSDKLPNYSFITPDLCNDMHDTCAPQNDPIKQGDDWLSVLVPKIMASKAYADGATLLITWDEGASGSDGPIGMIALGKHVKAGATSMTHTTHSSTVRTIQEIFGLSPFLGDAANATDLIDLFTDLPKATK